LVIGNWGLGIGDWGLGIGDWLVVKIKQLTTDNEQLVMELKSRD
jgi:hypothetical protein